MFNKSLIELGRHYGFLPKCLSAIMMLFGIASGS